MRQQQQQLVLRLRITLLPLVNHLRVIRALRRITPLSPRPLLPGAVRWVHSVCGGIIITSSSSRGMSTGTGVAVGQAGAATAGHQVREAGRKMGMRQQLPAQMLAEVQQLQLQAEKVPPVLQFMSCPEVCLILLQRMMMLLRFPQRPRFPIWVMVQLVL